MELSFSRRLRVVCACVLSAAGLSFCSSTQSPAAKIAAVLPSSPAPERNDLHVGWPNATVTAKLPQEAYMHFLLLPWGRMDGAIVGQAAFEPRGHRAAFLATFPGATIGGDWRRLNPVQAFVFDPGARALRALPSVGDVKRIAWSGSHWVELTDGSAKHKLDAGEATSYALPPLRMTSPNNASESDVIAQAGDGRLLLARNDAGRFAALQVGARSFRFEGACPDGAYALIGSYVAWVDRAKTAGTLINRGGLDVFEPPSFTGSAFGDAVVPVLPLGHAVYQGSYRNGQAYFAFTYGMQRIVAATRDLISLSFPPLPAEPVYTVGDGFGADKSGHLYFARPEDDQVLYWRNGHYVHELLHFPSGNGRSAELYQAMQIIASQDPLWPPLRPDEDALDAALLAWRVYPVGDPLGRRWIASYLGHLMRSDERGFFRYAAVPRYPFALLGRSDDGRVWGATPLSRNFEGQSLSEQSSALWWSRDGTQWHSAGQFPGDVGAVGLSGHAIWVAMTQPWLGHSEIAVMRVGDSAPSLTGGSYAGEQLFFATLDSGLYLLWGTTPGKRRDSQQGTLSAYRIDAAALTGDSGGGMNVFTMQLLQPSRDPSLPAAHFSVDDAQAIVEPSLQALGSLTPAPHATLATNAVGVHADAGRVTIMSFDQERAYEIKYATVPYPLAWVQIELDGNGNGALVRRSLVRGQLFSDESVERWQRDGSGQWRLAAVLSRSSANL